jgi:hypothetical protein
LNLSGPLALRPCFSASLPIYSFDVIYNLMLTHIFPLVNKKY